MKCAPTPRIARPRGTFCTALALQGRHWVCPGQEAFLSNSVVNLIVKRGCEDSPFIYIIRHGGEEQSTHDRKEAVRILNGLGVDEPERRLEQARQWGKANIATVAPIGGAF